MRRRAPFLRVSATKPLRYQKASGLIRMKNRMAGESKEPGARENHSTLILAPFVSLLLHLDD